MSLTLLAASSLSSSLFSKCKKDPLQRTINESPSLHAGKQLSLICCAQNKQSGDDDQGGKSNSYGTDRRNVLLGLGGLCGATVGVSQGNTALASPVQPPNLSQCRPAYDTGLKENVNCCPPYTSAKIMDFVPPSPSEPLRRRKAVNKLTKNELENFKKAVQVMKDLDKDDPWNFMQQATVHCAYCNGGYDQVGFTDVQLQMHGSWLFLPWHRFYIYYWERILGKLIGDPTFAIPYWNWDNPEGMRMSPIYLDKNSPLYNELRNHNHEKALVDYTYKKGAPNPTPDQEKAVILKNLWYLLNMYSNGLERPSLFMGGPLRAGEGVPTDDAGTLETLHNTFHLWCGPETAPFHDMGNFATSARDTIFFGLHANVDRLWSVYTALRGNKPDFNDADWLNASFIFYDENKQVVKVKVQDCLDIGKLGYTYEQEKLEWKDCRKAYKKFREDTKKGVKEGASLTPVSEFGSEPRFLDKPLRVLVPRPKVSRTISEKEDEQEVLVVDGIEIEEEVPIRFDVYVDKPVKQLAGPDFGELAGCFVRVPHIHAQMKVKQKKAKLQLGITKLLDDIEAESSNSLVVTFVPGQGKVTIGGVRIQLEESDL